MEKIIPLSERSHCYIKGKRLSTHEYCPQFRDIKTWGDLHRRQLNREAELMSKTKTQKIDNKTLLKWIRKNKVKHYSPGIYNFVTYQIKKVLP